MKTKRTLIQIRLPGVSVLHAASQIIKRPAAVVLVALAWGSVAFSGEIHDAAQSGDLDKVKVLLMTILIRFRAKTPTAARLCMRRCNMAKRMWRTCCDSTAARNDVLSRFDLPLWEWI